MARVGGYLTAKNTKGENAKGRKGFLVDGQGWGLFNHIAKKIFAALCENLGALCG
jgi:hypothetical protein